MFSNSKDSVSRNLTIVLMLLIASFALVLKGEFFSIANMQSIAFQLPELGLLTVAMMITMVTGGINLSIIAAANMSGITTAYIITKWISVNPDVSLAIVMLVAILAGLAVSFLIGVVNGYIVAYIGVSAILATLGTMTIIEGLSVLFTEGAVISGFPEPLLFIGNGTLYGVPVPLVIFLVCSSIVALFLDKTPFGVSTYMIGSNLKATEFSGVSVKKVLMKVYIMSGLLTGAAALIMISRFNSARAGYANSYLLVTVLASVLGGVNPDGGFGKVKGVFLALVILQVISSGLNLLGLSSHLAISMWGLILITVVAIPILKEKFLSK